MLHKKLAILTALVMIASIVLSACGPTQEPVVVKETSVVVVTVMVPGEEVPVEVTKIVEKEVVVTATPVPVEKASSLVKRTSSDHVAPRSLECL